MLALKQLVKFALVGLFVNGCLYLAYLALTRFGMGHKLAMTLLYLAGIFSAFTFNRNWTFQHDGKASLSLLRYVFAYLCGYVLNLGVLIVLVDRHGLQHEYVQGVMILFLAVFFFLLQKFWIFRDQSST